MTKIKDTPAALRPREKLLQKGADALSKSDLLAILLGSGIKGINAEKTYRLLFDDKGKNYGDLTKINADKLPNFDVMVA